MSTQRRSGIATVMFTDVEASTDTTTRLGDDAAARLFARHDRIVGDLVAAHGGRRVRSTGDGFLVLFDSARSAVACALEIERDLAAEEDGVRVRIGLSAGEVIEGDGEVFGAAVNLAARVMERARGGEVLVSDTVRQVAGTMPEARFRDRGRVALKGFPERQRLHEVRAVRGRAPPRARRRSRRPVVAGAAAGMAAGAALLAVFLATTGSEEPIVVRPNSVAILDAESGKVVDQIGVGPRPADVAAAAGSVWVSNLADNTVTQIEARSRQIAGTITPGITVNGLAASPSGVWVADSVRASARVIDLAFGSVASAERLGTGGVPEDFRPVAATAKAVWIAGNDSGVVRLDPRTRRVLHRTPVGSDPTSVAVGAGGVWVSDQQDGTVTRIDPRTNRRVKTITVGESAAGIAVGAGSVWVAVPFLDRVMRIDPASNAVGDTVPVSGAPAAVAFGAGALWVTTRRGGTVVRIAPGSPQPHVTRTVEVGNSPQGIAVVGGNVWVAVQASPAPAASTPAAPDVATVLRLPRLFTIDPALTFGTDRVMYATCALLLNYPDLPYPPGAVPHPEVARAMPTVSDGGRTYTFHVRPGFRFSPPSGAPVTAAAFSRAIERALNRNVDSGGAALLGDVVGFSAYHAGRTDHLAGVTARGDELTIRLQSPSATLPSRMASTYFCAVPPTTPISVAGIERIPMAGPYYVASYRPQHELVLRRNPNYSGSRPARLREIKFELDVGAADATDDVQAGRADYVAAVAPTREASLDRRHGPHSAGARAGRQRYFSGPAPALHFFVFNVRRPLFASKLMRRAFNAAIDRRALAVRVHSGRLAAGAPGRPTDQFIPPGLRGFDDVDVYRLGGDVERARRLAGEHPRRRAVLYTCNEPSCVEQGRVMRRNLAAIGLDLDVKTFPILEMFDHLASPKGWDIGYGNWFVDAGDPSEFIIGVFGDPAFPGGFHDDALFPRMRAATRLGDAARARAFAQLDEDFTRAAAAAPFATAATTDFFSDRMGCQVHQPIYGISLAALCVRDS